MDGDDNHHFNENNHHLAEDLDPYSNSDNHDILENPEESEANYNSGVSGSWQRKTWRLER